MKPIQIATGLLVGVMVVGACRDQSVPTATSDQHSLVGMSGIAGQTSVVLDPVGDASWDKNSGPGSAKKAPAWVDITRAAIAKTGKTFVFTMDLADVVPATPEGSTLVWLWGLDTDPATAPAGDPFGPNRSNPFEFFVDIEWDGSRFVGLLYDRRALLTGGAMLLAPVPFTIDGAQINLFVDASALGDPTTFAWGSATLTRQSDGHLGTQGWQAYDFAPDEGLPLATWPQ